MTCTVCNGSKTLPDMPEGVTWPCFFCDDSRAELRKLAEEIVNTPIVCEVSGCSGIWWQGNPSKSNRCEHLFMKFVKAGVNFVMGGIVSEDIECPDCQGRGHITCLECGGSGEVPADSQ